MAILTNPGVVASGGGSGSPRWVILSFQNVTAADTFDLATLTNPAAFSTVTAAVFVAESNRTATTTLSTIATNTNVSFLGTGISRDAGILFAVGE